MIDLSIVVPLYNEADNIFPLYAELKKSLRLLKKSYEILYIDDGSSDTSLSLLQSLAKKDKHIHVVSFRKNMGKSMALSYAFSIAQGTFVATLDADLEDKPSELPRLLQKLGEEYDLVSGWRKNRKHSGIMVGASWIFNKLMELLWGLHLHDYNCGLKVYRSDVTHSIRLYGGLHRFIPLLAHQQGFRVTELAVTHEKRRFGKSKYGFSKVLTDAPDLATMWFISTYGTRPLHLFGSVGLVFLLAGTGILIYLVILKMRFEEGIGDRPLLLLGVLMVLSGFQLFFTGLLADLMLNFRYRDREHEVPIRYTNL
ncbi:MAG: glycosyltransferase family 2 protein [Candidatus Roizmanbacteria bacterium]|nr:glycosyltransferase family 2 protein [Candidatus Roizmanbacteria bacterium]